ncbi:MAG: nucleotide disphospho-sugar-binding domain-containing protein [Sneathiella sp.]
MARIVFGLEFGANLGHVYPMLRVADALREKDHEIIFVCRDVDIANDAIKAKGYALVQAPYWKNPNFPNLVNKATPTYADVMARQGFGLKKSLVGILTAWGDLMTLLKPDLVIADHSPGLALAIGGQIPTIVTGNGFTLPPTGIKQYPPVISKAQSLVSQDELLSFFNEIREARGAQRYTRLPQIFEVEGHFVYTLPQLDPYGDVRDRPIAGPLEEIQEPAALPEQKHAFVYMANNANGVRQVLGSLKSLAVQTTAYIRGASRQAMSEFQSDKMEMLEQPVDYSEILPKVSTVIHSGGNGTATACLMVGRAQIIIPSQSETASNARLLTKNGLARTLNAKADNQAAQKLIEEVLSDHSLHTNCLKIAKEIAKGDWQNAVGKIVDRAELLLSKQPKP